MKNVLFITESYYYKASPNAICVQKVAEHLVNKEYSVSVVTLYNDIGQSQFESINGVDVYRVDAGFIEARLYENSTNKKKYNRTLKLSRINGLLHAFRYPLLSERQVKHLYRQASALHKEKHFDYVVSVYHKIADVLAGIKLKKKNPDIKLVLYTLDAISGGWVPNILHSSKIPMKSLKRWERYFFKYIDKMFAMESHRSYYQKNHEYDKYAEKIEYLDIPLLEPCISEKDTSKEIKMVYTGSMALATANPWYLLKILDKIENAKVFIYGRICDEILKEIQSCSLYEKRIFLMGSVEHSEIAKIQQSADVLLNFGNANSNMIPCKIFEYMSTGNKILSFTHSSQDSSLPYIEKYPNGLIVEEDESLDGINIEKIKEFISSEHKALNEKELKKVFLKNTPEYFEERLSEV